MQDPRNEIHWIEFVLLAAIIVLLSALPSVLDAITNAAM